jgi:ATP-dependent DNA helicase RecG
MSRLIDLKGIGPKTASKFDKLGIQTINDLLFLFPANYQIQKIDEFDNKELDKDLTLVAKVHQKPRVFFIRKNLDKLSLQVEINHVIFYVHIFNRRFLSKSLIPGTEIVLTGRFIKNYSSFTASNIVLLKNFKQGIIPQYNLKEINDSIVRKTIHEVLSYDINLPESLPDWILNKHNIPRINELINKIHQPKNESDLIISRKRIVYEELLEFALKIESLKKLNQTVITIAKKYDIQLVRGFISRLPFTLTNDQKEATNEIFKDLKSNKQMNRLLQGDVGSGKTIISIIASLAVVSAKQQVAIMAPTLVLAKQHFETFIKYLEKYNIRIVLLTSEMKIHEKRIISESIRNNEIDIVIGTHALIQEDVDFHNLGFIVIDEQHRFGVKQRRELRTKGSTPDILLMSATPIPRTLAISIYKDIDISFIKEKPIGRKEIITKIIEFENLNNLIKDISVELNEGHQIYFICPIIEESETSSKISVSELKNIIKPMIDDKYNIEILHGKLNDHEKTKVLNRFYKNDVQVLVSTTVVEVGVNVRNATVMVILNADSFGLAQLHQLRGRIGRNELQSFCYLVVDDILSNNERLQVMTETNDGFLISEYDLRHRGPGEVFGKSQSGVPVFKMANILNDESVLEVAFEDAKEIIVSKDNLSKKLTNKAIKSIESYNLD